jgi:hypothetical protein
MAHETDAALGRILDQPLIFVGELLVVLRATSEVAASARLLSIC